MEEKISEFLRERNRNGLNRILREVINLGGGTIEIEEKKYRNLSSNDYLGLSSHARLIRAAAKHSDTVSASTSSPLITGRTFSHAQLEKETALFKSKHAALVFSSGWQANVGMIDSLVSKGDAVFCDRLSHSSILDGCRLSGARFFRFRHNDSEHLKDLLVKRRSDYKSALIVTESVFSMDGDTAPLEAIVELKNRFDCMLMVDEAHATGIFGKDRAGIVQAKGLTKKVDLIMGTFSKALAGFGAYVATSQKIKDYLVNTCRSYIYSTALPPGIIACNREALSILGEEKHRAQVLLQNSEWLRAQLRGLGFEVRGCTQILPVILKKEKLLSHICERLRSKGWWVTPVRPPTVPSGESRMRISLSYMHSKQELLRFKDDFARIL